MKLTKFAFAMAITLTGCTSQSEHLKSLNPDYFDKNTPVGEDFYMHVNRGWLEAHPLTDEFARYGNFNILADTAEVRVRDLVLGLGATNPEKGSVAQKVSTI
ncbi:MAG: M13 family metallopeptidase, partial [Muribaculaceae bacterium]|nr:M13 family metallopeptidase [Muribaculaceae bacterium]